MLGEQICVPWAQLCVPKGRSVCLDMNIFELRVHEFPDEALAAFAAAAETAAGNTGDESFMRPDEQVEDAKLSMAIDGVQPKALAAAAADAVATAALQVFSWPSGLFGRCR